MKMLWNEILKVTTKNTFLIVFATLFVANTILLVNYNKNSNINQMKTEYQTIYNEFKGEITREKLHELEQLEFDAKMFNAISQQIMSVKYHYPMKNELIEDNKDKMTSYYKRYSEGNYLKYAKEIYQEQSILSDIYSQAKELAGYNDYIKSMQERADNLQSISIFSEEGGFDSNNIKRTPSDFADVKDVIPRLDISQGVIDFTEFRMTDIILLFLIILICNYLFMNEMSGLLRLTRPTANGRAKFVLAKIGAVSVIMIVSCLLFYIANAVVILIKFGFGDLSRPIQSVQGYLGCDIPISVGQYLCLFILTKLFVLLVLVMIVITLTLLLRNAIYLIISLIGIATLSVVFSLTISPSSYLNLLKYLNLVDILSVFKLYKVYTNINLFTKPINIIPTTFVVCIAIVIPLLFFCTWWFSKRDLTANKITFVSTWIEKIHNKKELKGTVSVHMHELRKSLISNKGLYILLVFVLLQGYLFMQNNVILFLSSDELYYKEFITSIEGNHTQKKEALLQEKMKKQKEVQKELYAFVKENKDSNLSEFEYMAQMQAITAQGMPSYAYSKIMQQRNAIYYGWKQHMNLQFVYDTGYTYFFENKNADILNAIQGCVAIILLLCGMIASEKSSDMLHMITTTPKGRVKTFMRKWSIAMRMTTLVFLITYVPEIIIFAKQYGFSLPSASLQSIALFRNVSFESSILGFFILNYFMKWLGMIIVANTVLLISSKSKTVLQSIFVSSLIFIIPLIVSLLGLDIVSYFSFSYLFYPSQLVIKNQHNFFRNIQKEALVFYLGFFQCVGMIAMFWCYDVFAKEKLDRRKKDNLWN